MRRRLILTAALLTTSMPGLGVNTDTATVKDAHNRGGAAPLLSLGGAPAPSPTDSTAAPARTPGRIGPSKASRSRVTPKHRVTGKLLNSTAYCETGLMADGHRTYRGAVASNAFALGTRLLVSDSPYGPGLFTVTDRIGHGSQLDFATPGDCTAARAWGRRDVHVQDLP